MFREVRSRLGTLGIGIAEIRLQAILTLQKIVDCLFFFLITVYILSTMREGSVLHKTDLKNIVPGSKV